jgi:hypothetical protein
MAIMSSDVCIKRSDFTQTALRQQACALWHDGRLKDARLVLEREIKKSEIDAEEIVLCRILLAQIHWAEADFAEALTILQAAETLATATSHQAQARFHNALGNIYRKLAEAGDASSFDKSLTAYEAARFYAEQAADFTFAGYLANNIALVLCRLERTGEAHEQLAIARRYFIDDEVRAAEVEETEAQVYLAEHNPQAARSLALHACYIFDKFGETRLLNDALRTLLKSIGDCGAEREAA